MTVNVAPAARVTPVTVMSWPETETVPVEEVVKPAADPVNDGADQPEGTVTLTAPPDTPPVAAVYVNTNVLPAEPFTTEDVGVVNDPDPSAAYTLIDGEAERLVSVPPETAFDCVCQVAEPAVEEAVAPGPAEAVEP